MSKDLIRRLDIKAGVMEMGEKIAWGSDTALMREAQQCIGVLMQNQRRCSFNQGGEGWATPLPDLDVLQSDIDEWAEAMAYNAQRGAHRWHYGSAAISLEQASRSIDLTRQAMKIIEQEQGQ